MPRLHVCSLQRMFGTVRDTGARDLVTLVKPGTAVPRPESIAPHRHLVLNIADIVEPMEGEVLAGAVHVEKLLAFVGDWDRQAPLVIHCYAGVSRSTAAAFITACALLPEAEEGALAARLRMLSPTATPNRHLVTLADTLLGRRGRMVHAVEAIGRGAECYEGIPFAFDGFDA